MGLSDNVLGLDGRKDLCCGLNPLKDIRTYRLNYKARFYDSTIGSFTSVDLISDAMLRWSPYNYPYNNPIRFIDPDGRNPDDFVQRSNGSIYWDNTANSQATITSGEIYLGSSLTLCFNSFIDTGLWDGPGGSVPVGDKLTSSITLTGSENSSGELTGISASSDITIGSTPVGTGRDFFLGLGLDQNKFSQSQTITNGGALNSFSLNFEKHASVSPIEQMDLSMLGYDIVNVAQQLNVNVSGNELSASTRTDVFPSATLSVNGSQLFKYNQPSVKGTHGRKQLGTTPMPIRTPSPSPAPLFHKRY